MAQAQPQPVERWVHECTGWLFVLLLTAVGFTAVWGWASRNEHKVALDACRANALAETKADVERSRQALDKAYIRTKVHLAATNQQLQRLEQRRALIEEFIDAGAIADDNTVTQCWCAPDGCWTMSR